VPPPRCGSSLEPFPRRWPTAYREEITCRLGQEPGTLGVFQALRKAGWMRPSLGGADILRIPLRGTTSYRRAGPCPRTHAPPPAETALRLIGVISRRVRLLPRMRWRDRHADRPGPHLVRLADFPALAHQAWSEGQPALPHLRTDRPPETSSGTGIALLRVPPIGESRLFEPRPARRRGGQRPGCDACTSRQRPWPRLARSRRPAAVLARHSPRRLLIMAAPSGRCGQRPVLPSQQPSGTGMRRLER